MVNQFKNWTESVTIINVGLLVKDFGNQEGFVMFNRATNTPLDYEYPFAVNDVHIQRIWNQGSCAILEESIKLLIHG